MTKDKNFHLEVLEKLETLDSVTFWVRFRTCNAWVARIEHRFMVQDTVCYVIPIKSYETIVGYADILEKKFYEIGHYSVTTSKQMGQIHKALFSDYERVKVL